MARPTGVTKKKGKQCYTSRSQRDSTLRGLATSDPPPQTNNNLGAAILPTSSSFNPLPSKVIVAIDLGTMFVKAAYKIIYRSQEPIEIFRNGLISGMHAIRWSKGNHCTANQLVYVEDLTIDDGFVCLIGDEVDRGLEDGTLVPEDVFKFLKPALFRTQDKAHPDLLMLQRQLEFFRLRMPGKTVADLYTDLLTEVWRYITNELKKKEPRLVDRWADVRIEVALTLPADSRPEMVEFMLERAVKAGIPNPYPVSESSAVAANYLQECAEEYVPFSTGQCRLILDIGGVREEVKGSVTWSGGQSVNHHCVDHLKRVLGPRLPAVISGLQERDRTITENVFWQSVSDNFEIVKREYNGFDPRRPNETVRVPIPGLQECAEEHGRVRTGALQLTSDDMRVIFHRSFHQITSNLDDMIRRIRRLRNKDIYEIVLAGGGSDSPYLSRLIRDKYQEAEYHPIPVKDSADRTTRGSQLSIARGALLLCIDRKTMTDRAMARAYCIKQDVLLAKRHGFPSSHIYLDAADGRQRLANASQFLTRIGDRIGPLHHATPRRGWISLFRKYKTSDGWRIEEPFFYSDTMSEDFEPMYVAHRGKELKKAFRQAGDGIVFYLKDEDTQDFPVKTAPLSGETYREFEYDFHLTIKDYLMLEFALVIPRTGVFGNGDDVGPQPIRVEGRLECAAMFHLLNGE